MKNDKMWAGRFSKNTAQDVHKFNRSIDFDYKLYSQDIKGSLAHAHMLESINILSSEEYQAIVEGLTSIETDITTGSMHFDLAAEDIHMFIEAELTKRIGEAGKKLHTGRSRNDQVALDLRLYTIENINTSIDLLVSLVETLITLAYSHLDTIMPGYTHLQRAQPITFSHHLNAYVQMFLRDISRLKDAKERMDECPLGAAALAGSSMPLDRELVAKELGFSAVSLNSMDAVADRDFALETASALALTMVHLSRFSEEIIIWNSSEFSFIELDDAYATGSSIMPQKKNPDVAELCRGKAARVIADMNQLFILMKSLTLAYNKDMQEDKEALFDAFDTLQACLVPFIGMLKTLTVNKGRMLEAAAGGFTNATEVADYLAKKGLAFREAHAVSGKLVAKCLASNCQLSDLDLNTFKEQSALFEEDIYTALDLHNTVARRSLIGGPAPVAVKVSLKKSQEKLKQLCS